MTSLLPLFGQQGRPRLPLTGVEVGDDAFRLRVRTLTRLRPVVELVASARWGDRYPDVDAAGLALAAVDLVVARQGLPDAVTYEEAVGVLTRLSAVADPAHAADGHRALAMHVLDVLLNKANHQAKFSFEVGNWFEAPDVAYRRSLLEFWLLREREERASGRLVLHADADAINALVSGLAFDVADEQAAAELVLRRQIARGEFGKAEATAQRNLQLTVQYAEELDAVLVETRRDVRAAAPRWQSEIPGRLRQARDHLQERLNEEDGLLAHLRTAIDAPPRDGRSRAPRGEPFDDERPALIAAAARAARLLERCRERHHELLRRVLDAIGVFLEAQEDQAFRPSGSLRVPDLGQEVLKPLLQLPVSQAEAVGASFLTALSVSPRRMVRLADLLEAMLASPRGEFAERVNVDPEGPGEEMPAAVPPALIQAARDCVSAAGLPVRLSVLVRAAATLFPAAVPGQAAAPGDATAPGSAVEPEDAAAPEPSTPDGDRIGDDITADRVASLLASGALWLFAPDAGQDAGVATAHEVFGSAAMAAADGTPLPADLRSQGWYGDDLIIAASEDQLLATLGESQEAR